MGGKKQRKRERLRRERVRSERGMYVRRGGVELADEGRGQDGIGDEVFL